MEHRLVGVGITVPVLVQLRFPSGGGVGTGLGGGPAPGTLLGPEGSGFGLFPSATGLPRVGGLLVRGRLVGEPLACRPRPWGCGGWWVGAGVRGGRRP